MTDSRNKLAGTRTVSWRAVLLLFVAAFAARGGYGMMRGGGLQYDDEHWYWSIARSYADGAGMVGEFGHRAERMPLYPWFLSLFESPQSVRVVQWGLGALAAIFVYLLARDICRYPWVAGLIVALDPTLVGSASLLLSETLAVTAIAGLWWAMWPLRMPAAGSVARWMLVAVWASLCVYARESSVLLVGGLLVFLMIARRDRQGVLGAGAVGLTVMLTLVPWGMRNQRVLGGWCWFTTRGGISLYDGVRPGANGASDLATVKDQSDVQGLSELAWDTHFRNAACAAMRNDPARIAALVPVKLARTWSPVLNASEYASRAVQIVFAGWYVPLYLLILAGAWAQRCEWRNLIALLLPALCVCALHSVFVGSVRYRLVALPGLAVLAAIGLAYVFSRRRADDPQVSAS